MKRKKFNKKGMFFTIMTIAVLSLFVVSYGVHSYVKDRTAINKRIETMNNFVFSIEQDLPRKLYLSGFTTIFLIEKYIAETGSYISNGDDFNSLFQEAFYDGSIKGVDHASEGGIMYGVTLSGILNSLNDMAKDMNMNISLVNPVVSVGQEDPWNVKISLTTNLLIEDDGNLALWERLAVINSYVPIKNFEDPLYLVETNGLITNKINQTPYDVPVLLSDLSNHVEGKYYINSSDGPSFIDRLEGKKTESVEGTGIESLVYLPDLSAQGIPVKDKSVVDYIYFSVSDPDPLTTPDGMPDWFKLDDPHVLIYGV